jgi:HK97 gp10 family phage protein
MAIRGTFKLTGLEEYLAKIQNAGNDIEGAVKEAMVESAKPVLDDMSAGAMRHIRTGKVVEALEISSVNQEGNYIFVEVGVNEQKAKEGAWVAVFQEYGAPTFPKDPFIRPAFDNNALNVRSIQRKILKKWGIPIK